VKTYLDCIPCFVRQTLESVRAVTTDQRVHEEVLRRVLTDAAEMGFATSPPAMAQRIHRSIRELTGNADPYADRKRQMNDLAVKLRERLRQRVSESADPLEAALRLAIAGNMMDLGAKSNLDDVHVTSTILACFDEPFDADVPALRRDIAQARSILYLADNAGEIVLDRLLVEQLPRDRTVVAVRGGPVINDATRADAVAAGLTALVEVIDNGSDAPGTILADCSEDFRRRFEQADLIISKGQGNYETLSESPNPITFLLRVKCPVIARDLGRPTGSMVMHRSQRDISVGGECERDAADEARAR